MVYRVPDDLWDIFSAGDNLLCPPCFDARCRSAQVYLYWEAAQGDFPGTGAREAEGSGLLSRPASDGRVGSNPAPSVFVPPYRYEYSEHGPVTIYDGIDVGWIARVKESLPHKEAIAAVMVEGLNAAALSSSDSGHRQADQGGTAVAVPSSEGDKP